MAESSSHGGFRVPVADPSGEIVKTRFLGNLKTFPILISILLFLHQNALSMEKLSFSVLRLIF